MRLVLLPGLDGTGRLFRRLVSVLPRTLPATVVAYPASCSEYSKLLPIVQSALPQEERFVLVAESYSGPLAIAAAAARPKGLAGVVLAASFARRPVPWLVARASRFVPITLLFRLPWVLQAAALLGLKGRAGPVAAEVKEAVGCVSREVLARRLRGVLDLDVVDMLREIAAPILYVAARRDPWVRRKSAALIQRSASSFRLVTLDAPHLVLQQSPEAAAQVIAEFVASFDR